MDIKDTLEEMKDTLEEMKGQWSTYNKIANWLYDTFDTSCAELVLLLTYYELNRKEILKIEDLSYEVCQDLKKVIEIVFSDKYPEYKEDELIELLEPYALKKGEGD